MPSRPSSSTFFQIERQLFSCGKQLYRRLCLSVCPSVCLSVRLCVCLSRTFYHVPIAGSSWNLHQTLISWNACGTYNFRSKGQRSRSQGSFEDFVVSALWLHGYLTYLLYTWHKYSPWHGDVSRSNSRSKVQRSRSHRSFQMKVTRVVRSFGRVRSVAPSLLDRFTSYVEHTQPMRWRYVPQHLRVKRSKVKVTRVVRNFCCVCFVAPGTHTAHVHIQPRRGQCVVHHFQVKRTKFNVTQVVHM